MFIDCPGCARSYHINAADIGSRGRKVICPQCRTDWFVHGGSTRSSSDLRAMVVSSRTAPLAVEGRPAAARKRPSLLRRSSVPLAIAACILLSMAALGAREKIVKYVPRTASLYDALGLPTNIRGLEIVAAARREPDMADVRVTGTIRNITPHRQTMPRLVYDVRDARGAPLATWTETPPAPSLANGRSLAFVSSPHALPPQSSSVIVRFETSDEAPSASRRQASNLY